MKSRNKDKKPHESIIGKIIYGFLLFMPLLAIGVTCAYAIFNKNAYQSYSGETQSEETITYISNLRQDLKVEEKYTFNSSTFINQFSTNMGSYNNQIIFEDFELVSTTLNITNTPKRIGIYYNTSYITYLTYRLYDDNNTAVSAVSSSTDVLIFNFSYLANNLTNDWKNTNIIYETNISSNAFIDNVFYYSIDKVKQSPLFNWAEESAIYTGMTATCNALNITTTFIPLLLTYWLIISVIYILYDIILIILHIFHKKIHQLEDSF